MIKLLGVSVIGTIVYAIIKKYSPEYTVLVEIATVIIVLFMAYPYLCDIIDFFSEYNSSSKINGDFLKIIIKSMGLALVTQFSSDMCRDNGENALASKIEFAGKTFMIVSAIPMAKTIIELALRIIEKE